EVDVVRLRVCPTERTRELQLEIGVEVALLRGLEPNEAQVALDGALTKAPEPVLVRRMPALDRRIDKALQERRAGPGGQAVALGGVTDQPRGRAERGEVPSRQRGDCGGRLAPWGRVDWRAQAEGRSEPERGAARAT